MATKRKHVTLRLDLRGCGCSFARISAEYGIGKSTVCDILEKKRRNTYVNWRRGEDINSI